MLFDMYCCHIMGSVDNASDDMGVEVENILGSYMGVHQPVDFEINRSLELESHAKLVE